jgi:hypothetical protein
VGVIPEKPSRNFTCPLGMPRGLKCLLYMLNVIVSSTKVDLCFLLCFLFFFFLFSFFLFFFFFFSFFFFFFAKGLTKCKFEGI